MRQRPQHRDNINSSMDIAEWFKISKFIFFYYLHLLFYDQFSGTILFIIYCFSVLLNIIKFVYRFRVNFCPRMLWFCIIVFPSFSILHFSAILINFQSLNKFAEWVHDLVKCFTLPSRQMNQTLTVCFGFRGFFFENFKFLPFSPFCLRDLNLDYKSVLFVGWTQKLIPNQQCEKHEVQH